MTLSPASRFCVDCNRVVDDPENHAHVQSECSCCYVVLNGHCYGDDAKRTERPEQMCATSGCVCWGGPDRECEDCWLASK